MSLRTRLGRSPIFVLLLAVAIFAACDADLPRIDLTERETSPAPSVKLDPLRVGLGAMITPRAGFGYYWELTKYLETRLGRPVELVDRGSYGEVNRLLAVGRVDVAFVCSRPYVLGREEFGLELLVAPVVDGETNYYSLVLVNRDSKIVDLQGLRGGRFAFVDPLSNTGCLAPSHELAGLGETPEGFFGEVHYTHGHDKSIQAVAQGAVDGAAVDSLVWRNLARSQPELAARTRVIRKIGPFGIPPVVTRPGLDPALRERVKEVFLGAHLDTDGMRILDGMGIDRFAEIADSAYDGVRAMRTRVAAAGPRGKASGDGDR